MIGRPASLRWPTPKIVVQITEIDTRNAPATANGARQRAARHNRGGSVNASGSNETHDWVGWVWTPRAIDASRESTTRPWIASLREGGSRYTRPSSITSGATTTMPMASDRNHARQA